MPGLGAEVGGVRRRIRREMDEGFVGGWMDKRLGRDNGSANLNGWIVKKNRQVRIRVYRGF